MLVLQTLSVQPLHGYGIAQQIEALSGDALRVEQGSLYPALERLQKKGWITSKWGEVADRPARALLHHHRRRTPPARQTRSRASTPCSSPSTACCAAPERHRMSLLDSIRYRWRVLTRSREHEAGVGGGDGVLRELRSAAARACADADTLSAQDARRAARRAIRQLDILSRRGAPHLRARAARRPGARRSLRAAHVRANAGLHGDRGRDARDRHRREHGDLQRGRHAAAHDRCRFGARSSHERLAHGAGDGRTAVRATMWSGRIRSSRRSASRRTVFSERHRVVRHADHGARRRRSAAHLGEFIDAQYFPTLGVTPTLGRALLPTEDHVGGPPVVVITDELWKLNVQR